MNRISYHFIYLHLVLPYRVYAYGLVISSILVGGATLQVLCRLQRFCYLASITKKTVQNSYNALAFFAILCIMKVQQLVTYVSYITRDKEGTYAYTASRTQ